MAEPDSSKFTCPHCGKGYRWKPEIAGRKLTCRSCEAKLRAPEQPGTEADLLEAPAPAPGEGDIYELDLPDDEPSESADSAPAGEAAGGATPGKCPSCNQPMKPGAVLCLNCGFNVQAGKRIKTVVGEEPAGSAAPPAGGGGAAPAGSMAAAMSRPGFDRDQLDADSEREHFQNEVTTPLTIGGIGLGLVLLNALVLYPLAINYGNVSPLYAATAGGWAQSATEMLATYGLGFVIQLPVMILAIWLVAKMFGTSFGAFSTALLKLAALALIVGGIDGLVESSILFAFGEMGACVFWVFQIGISVTVFMGFAMKFFDMEAGEAFVLWLLTVMLPIVLMIFVGTILLGMMFA